MLASLVTFLDGAIINVALPAMVRDLGGGLSLQQWVVDAYLITLGSLMLAAGSLSDVFGRKRILRLGLLGFGATSLLCAVAPTGAVLILARALQGATGALLVPGSLALILSFFSGPEQAKAIGAWTGWTGGAFIAGPLVGGLLVDTVGWRWIFAINVLPIGLTLALLARMEEPTRPEGARIDVLGAVLACVGLGGPVYALIEQGTVGWAHPTVLASLGVGVPAFIAFLWQERRSPHPMMPLGLFRVRNFWVGNLATTFIYGALALSQFLITLFLQQVGGFRATMAGLVLLPTTIIMLLLSSTFGGLAGRFGPRLFMAVGPCVAGAGFLLMLRVGTPLDFWTQMLPGVLVFGLGLTTTVAPLTAAVLGSVHKAQAGIGSAINNAIARVAGLIAIAFAGLIVGPRLDVAGFHRAMLVSAVLLVLGGVTSALGIRNPSREA
ncbi:MFS transporter [Corallococcus exiguus]|uniref:MFS transporter n=1 Tax=Corallococcus exiguus TaxID=83462 RepID=A0A7X5BW93_9BACT|nr:MFS transporter [Corallococcus exiguus]TNV64421.1 MFS transporter [Corallococcus exiguus]